MDGGMPIHQWNNDALSIGLMTNLTLFRMSLSFSMKLRRTLVDNFELLAVAWQCSVILQYLNFANDDSAVVE